MAFGPISNVAVQAAASRNSQQAANFNRYQAMLQGGMNKLATYQSDQLKQEQAEAARKVIKGMDSGAEIGPGTRVAGAAALGMKVSDLIKAENVTTAMTAYKIMKDGGATTSFRIPFFGKLDIPTSPETSDKKKKKKAAGDDVPMVEVPGELEYVTPPPYERDSFGGSTPPSPTGEL